MWHYVNDQSCLLSAYPFHGSKEHHITTPLNKQLPSKNILLTDITNRLKKHKANHFFINQMCGKFKTLKIPKTARTCFLDYEMKNAIIL